MIPYKIRYLRTAQNDLDDIFTYISNDNPSAAMALLDNADQTIAQLATNPYLGRVPKDYRLKRMGYHMLVIQRYIVFYVIKEEVVQVRRIIHGVRRYAFLL